MEAEDFIRPPEAPVFQPTLEEFEDPIAYISKIRPVVLNTGICKIKPPPVSYLYDDMYNHFVCILLMLCVYRWVYVHVYIDGYMYMCI